MEQEPEQNPDQMEEEWELHCRLRAVQEKDRLHQSTQTQYLRQLVLGKEVRQLIQGTLRHSVQESHQYSLRAESLLLVALAEWKRHQLMQVYSPVAQQYLLRL